MGKKIALGFQHVLAMFGATVLVPLLTGLDPAIALFAAGAGTLIFHLCTKGKVPVFLGSSFAFITATILILNPSSNDMSILELKNTNWEGFIRNLSYLKGGLICTGLVYVVIAVIIYFVGVEAIQKLFPPIVTGPIIVVIGLSLSPTAIQDAFYEPIVKGKDTIYIFNATYAFVAAVVVITMIITTIFAKGFFKVVPILIAVAVGYIVSIPFDLVDFSLIKDTKIITLMDSRIRDQVFLLPRFSLSSILAIAPIALVVFVEHIGDITTNGAVVGKNFLKDPGVHRTLLGDGLATAFAGLIGGPANTTYSENTGVLAVTKVYNPVILRIAAIFAMGLSLLGPFNGFIRTIPGPVRGGVSIILFGMIASVGMRILINAQLDFSHSRNLIIAAVILVLGIGVQNGIQVASTDITISGLTLAALSGVILNILLPEEI